MSPAEGEVSSAAVQVVDAAGQALALEAPARRIVVVGRADHMVLHLLAMFPGWSDVLVGLEQRGGDPDEFLLLLDPALSNTARLGVEPGPEEVAALRPDLVLTKGSVAGALAASLAPLGIPVAHVGLEDPERFLEDVRLVGALLGQGERAGEIVSLYRGRMRAVEALAASAPADRRPSVLVAEITSRGGRTAVKVAAAGWMQTLQVQRAGGRPVWLGGASQADGWTVVTLEQIAAWDPDRIVAVIPPGAGADEVLSTLRADPGWRLLRAVRDGELVAFPGDLYGWNSPDPRWILGLQWMAATLHPDAGLEMAEEVRGFYGELYGLDRATVDARLLPLVTLDAR